MIVDSERLRRIPAGLSVEEAGALPAAALTAAYGLYELGRLRAVERDGVILEIKYFYDGGDMASKPKVVTVIPKVEK